MRIQNKNDQWQLMLHKKYSKIHVYSHVHVFCWETEPESQRARKPEWRIYSMTNYCITQSFKITPKWLDMHQCMAMCKTRVCRMHGILVQIKIKQGLLIRKPWVMVRRNTSEKLRYIFVIKQWVILPHSSSDIQARERLLYTTDLLGCIQSFMR